MGMVFIEFSIGFKANVNENTLQTDHAASFFFGNKNYIKTAKLDLIENQSQSGRGRCMRGMGTTKNPVVLDSGSLDVLHCEFGTLRYIIFTYTSHTHT